MVSVALMAALSSPSPAIAAVVAPPADLAAFDSGFRAGQEQFNQKKYLDAARTWGRAAALLPEAEEHKENRRAIHEYIADAYERAAGDSGYEDIVREGLGLLDAYADDFVAAYPGDSLPENVTKVRMAFRTRLEQGEQARLRLAKPTAEPEAPQPPPPAPIVERPPPKPWKGLAIGGAVAVGGGAAMLAMFAAGAARAKSATTAFDDPANMCDLADPTGKCADIDGQGRRANAVAVAGLVLAPLLLGSGIAMLVIAKRRKSANTAFAPVFGQGTAGLVWHGRF